MNDKEEKDKQLVKDDFWFNSIILGRTEIDMNFSSLEINLSRNKHNENVIILGKAGLGKSFTL